jgi:hypothetical protein
VWPDVQQTNEIVLQTTKELTGFMQLMARNVSELMRSQWRQNLRMWFSSPDPSTNHVLLCGVQHQGTANWFFRGCLFEEWKSTGSLLWIHGKRMSFNVPHSTPDVTCLYSGIWKKRPLVRSFSCCFFPRDLNYLRALLSSRIS